MHVISHIEFNCIAEHAHTLNSCPSPHSCLQSITQPPQAPKQARSCLLYLAAHLR